jgi:hypothetical protein
MINKSTKSINIPIFRQRLDCSGKFNLDKGPKISKINYLVLISSKNKEQKFCPDFLSILIMYLSISSAEIRTGVSLVFWIKWKNKANSFLRFSDL